MNLDLAVPSPMEKKAGCKCGNRCGKHAESPQQVHKDEEGCAKRTQRLDRRVEPVPTAGGDEADANKFLN